jgi:bifunctional pyridoxal-dependent enzyme with beta-cystathionase and maltose regulon repressor activities
MKDLVSRAYKRASPLRAAHGLPVILAATCKQFTLAGTAAALCVVWKEDARPFFMTKRKEIRKMDFSNSYGETLRRTGNKLTR